VFAPDATATHQTSALQHPDVLRYRVQRHVKWLGKVGDEDLFVHDSLEDRPTHGMSQRSERPVDVPVLIQLHSLMISRAAGRAVKATEVREFSRIRRPRLGARYRLARFGLIDEWHVDLSEPFLRNGDRWFLAFRH
jgi:hypothetical protein